MFAQLVHVSPVCPRTSFPRPMLAAPPLAPPLYFPTRPPLTNTRSSLLPPSPLSPCWLCVALQVLSAVLLEVPNVALAAYDNRVHDMLSLSFHKVRRCAPCSACACVCLCAPIDVGWAGPASVCLPLLRSRFHAGSCAPVLC